MPRRMSREEQIRRMSEKHDHIYSYEKWGHPNSQKKSIVICHLHGDWETTYANHYLHGSGCPRCVVAERLLNLLPNNHKEDWYPRLLAIVNYETRQLIKFGPEDLIRDPTMFMANVLMEEVEEYEITGYIKNAADNGVPDAQELYEYLVEAGFDVDQ